MRIINTIADHQKGLHLNQNHNPAASKKDLMKSSLLLDRREIEEEVV
jgi:hypothetical protein